MTDLLLQALFACPMSSGSEQNQESDVFKWAVKMFWLHMPFYT